MSDDDDDKDDLVYYDERGVRRVCPVVGCIDPSCPTCWLHTG
jgi:hypothetical protein